MLRPRASSPLSVELESAIGWPGSTRMPDLDDGSLVDARALVGAHELVEAVLLELARVGLDLDALGGDAGDDAGDAAGQHLAGVERGPRLHAGADDGRLGLEQRHRLALHVRTHQGAVGVVVLQERDQRRGDADDLLGADVHVFDLVGPRLREGVAVARRHALVDEVALVVELGVGLRDVMLLFLVRGEVDDLVGHARADRESGRLLLLQLGDRLPW